MSIKVKVYNQKCEAVGEEKLSDKVFGVKVNEALVHQAMVAQMSNERQVLAHTKDRSEVRGGGRKPWRQKGTGRARAGSTRSPIWRGGGITFGPRSERNYKKNLNKKMKQKALFMVLSDKVENKKLVLLDKLEVKEFKTKTMNEMMSKLENEKVIKQENKKTKKQENKKTIKQESKKANKKAKRSVLIIIDKKDDKAKYSFRNLAGIKIINLDNMNILDLLKYRDLIISQAGVKKIEKRKE
ncbi:50S ribosomal protein L4 [Candidatus Falkowbacteria bacterium]|nr:MAG: 50S ribosomal protein L4 [Candidatus Falkowbacteria bacterium]